jgi:osmotically-inducible protein OsmY
MWPSRIISKSSIASFNLSETINKKAPIMTTGPLLHRIDTAIRKNPFVLHRRVFLESALGKVTLRGRVDSYYQKQMVQEVLRNLDGISEISNQLEVEDYAARTL